MTGKMWVWIKQDERKRNNFMTFLSWHKNYFEEQIMISIFFCRFSSFSGDNNGWPHLFDKYFGMPSHNTRTKSNICCKYSLMCLKPFFTQNEVRIWCWQCFLEIWRTQLCVLCIVLGTVSVCVCRQEICWILASCEKYLLICSVNF